jgi:uncharacterized peroxidase-related enzyme
MPQPDHISKLGVPDRSKLDEDLQQVFVKCVDKLGYVPNVLTAYSLRPQRLRNFMSIYNEIMLSPSGLSKLERETVAVVVSSANCCYYCLVAHAAAVRQPAIRIGRNAGAELSRCTAESEAATDVGFRLEIDGGTSSG